MKSHHQLVEEWKEEFDRCFPLPKILVLSGGKGVERDQMIAFLGKAMTVAARGAAEAAGIAKIIKPEFARSFGFNAAISQSERQLEDYFKEV